MAPPPVMPDDNAEHCGTHPHAFERSYANYYFYLYPLTFAKGVDSIIYLQNYNFVDNITPFQFYSKQLNPWLGGFESILKRRLLVISTGFCIPCYFTTLVMFYKCKSRR
jgi:hypothetical protein